MPMLAADVPQEIIDQLTKAASALSEQHNLPISRSWVIRQALLSYLERLPIGPRYEPISPQTDTQTAA